MRELASTQALSSTTALPFTSDKVLLPQISTHWPHPVQNCSIIFSLWHRLSSSHQIVSSEGHTRQFSSELRKGRLFGPEDFLNNRLLVRRLDETDPHSPFVSEPERALLEMLDDVPHKQSLDEARKIMEPLFNLRHDALQRLLEVCTRIKVKRLFFSLAEELQLPVLPLLNVSRIDFGATSLYVRTPKGHSLILKHPGKGRS